MPLKGAKHLRHPKSTGHPATGERGSPHGKACCLKAFLPGAQLPSVTCCLKDVPITARRAAQILSFSYQQPSETALLGSRKTLKLFLVKSPDWKKLESQEEGKTL